MKKYKALHKLLASGFIHPFEAKAKDHDRLVLTNNVIDEIPEILSEVKVLRKSEKHLNDLQKTINHLINQNNILTNILCSIELLKSATEWESDGYWIIRGERGVKINGRILFSNKQVHKISDKELRVYKNK